MARGGGNFGKQIMGITFKTTRNIAIVLGLMALPLAAQEAEDGVIGTCLDQGNTADVCICASVMLKVRVGPEGYLRYGEISGRIAAIEGGAVAEEGEMAALTGEGYQYFVPHGQAMSVCRKKLEAGS